MKEQKPAKATPAKAESVKSPGMAGDPRLRPVSAKGKVALSADAALSNMVNPPSDEHRRDGRTDDAPDVVVVEKPTAPAPKLTDEELAAKAVADALAELKRRGEGAIPAVLAHPASALAVYEKVNSGALVIALGWKNEGAGWVVPSAAGGVLARVSPTDDRGVFWAGNVQGTHAPSDSPLDAAKSWAIGVLKARGVAFVGA